MIEKDKSVIYGARVPGGTQVRSSDVRKCSRQGCRWPASASLTYAYLKKVVWVEDLTPQPHPAAYDLCAAHAERLGVPIGWTKEDLRVVPPPVTPIRPGIEAWQSSGEAPTDASVQGA
jgi:hypothetical protein